MRARPSCLEQQRLAGLEIRHLAARRERGRRHDVLILDVDDAHLVAVLRVEASLKLVGAGLISFGL